ncbi:hypothetical protein WJX74_004367 [Apatococcus lobatus]|uniref:Uncharacterized protein n=1 Tax=Apatococcus lobatus TaxID=904363 RepID=A0AAW1QZX3_9CHLO
MPDRRRNILKLDGRLVTAQEYDDAIARRRAFLAKSGGIAKAGPRSKPSPLHQAKPVAVNYRRTMLPERREKRYPATPPSRTTSSTLTTSRQGSYDLTGFPDLDILHTPKYQELLAALAESPTGSAELFSFPSLPGGSSPQHREMMDMIEHELGSDIAKGPASQRLARKRKASRKGRARKRHN